MSFQILNENGARAEQWIRRLTIAFCVIAILLGASQAWTHRYAMNADGVQYLDNADAYWAGDFRHAVNSQWSPLYPWLIGAVFAAAGHNPYFEFPLVHLLNFFIYLLSLAAFLFFLKPLANLMPSVRIGILLLAYSSFLYCTLDFTSLAYVAPDILVNVFVFLAAGWLLRIAAGGVSRTQFLVFGVLLGAGYLAKTPFLLFGLLCLAMAVVLTRKQPGAWRGLALATVGLAAIAIPYIALLSSAKGRFTFGDSARWNVIWMVNGVPYCNWQGGPPGNGEPIHPTRQLSTNPVIFEFARPIAATYPPWYDPIYWNEGARIAFRPADFVRAIVRQVRLYGYLVYHRQLALVFVLLAAVFLAKRSVLECVRAHWPILLLGITPFVMYAFVHADGRFLAPFFVLLWTVLFAGFLQTVEGRDSRAALVVAAVGAALMLVQAAIVTFPSTPLHNAQQSAISTSARLHYDIAEELAALGLKRGDAVAMVAGDLDYFWARLAGARIIMQVDFGKVSCPDCGERGMEWDKAKPILAANGVAMVVSPCVPGVVDQPGWQQLGTTGVYAYRFAGR